MRWVACVAKDETDSCILDSSENQTQDPAIGSPEYYHWAISSAPTYKRWSARQRDRQTDNICLFRPYKHLNILQMTTKYTIIEINGLWSPTLRLVAAIMWATKLLELVTAHQN